MLRQPSVIAAATILLVLSIPSHSPGRPMSGNVLARVLLVEFEDHEGILHYGTSFLFGPKGSRQYLVTAKHVLPGIRVGDNIRVGPQTPLDSSIQVDVPPITCTSGADAIAIRIGQRASADGIPFATAVGIGQEVHFVGFPYGIGTRAAEFAFALVKRGVLSGLDNSAGYVKYYLDAHANPVSSGGPVLTFNEDERRFELIGITSAYRFERKSVFKMEKGKEKETEFFVKENSGLMIAHGAKCIVDAIEENKNEDDADPR